MKTPHRGAVISSGLLLGAGLGGFVDGILFHQILQWHNLLSTKHPPVDLVAMKYNMVWDGAFHAFTWLTVVLGLVRLWRAGKRADVVWSGRTFVGASFFGWGLFNVIEGTIDHQLLELHHVHPGYAEAAWDAGFLGLGLLAMVGGVLAIRTGKADRFPPGSW